MSIVIWLNEMIEWDENFWFSSQIWYEIIRTFKCDKWYRFTKMKFNFIKKTRDIFMNVLKLLTLLAIFYSMWLIFEWWKHERFNDLNKNNSLHETTRFDRLKVNHFFLSKSFSVMTRSQCLIEPREWQNKFYSQIFISSNFDLLINHLIYTSSFSHE